MLAYQGDAEDNGAMIAFNSSVTKGTIRENNIELTVGESDQEYAVAANLVVNAAGLGAQRLAESIKGLNPKTIPDRYLARGCYFTISGKPPFQRLIYPVPEPGGLGVHVTLDMGGGIRFGPDVEWIDRVDYEIKPERAESFYSAI